MINPSHGNTVRLIYDCELVGKQVWMQCAEQCWLISAVSLHYEGNTLRTRHFEQTQSVRNTNVHIIAYQQRCIVCNVVKPYYRDMTYHAVKSLPHGTLQLSFIAMLAGTAAIYRTTHSSPHPRNPLTCLLSSVITDTSPPISHYPAPGQWTHPKPLV